MTTRAPRGRAASVSKPARGAASAERLSLFTVAAPGLEALAARELTLLGGGAPAIIDGGVAHDGALREIYRANLWLRTASRVLVRLGRFHASEFHELERHAKRLAWEKFVTPGRPVRFRVTCRKSRLYHSDAVAERFAGAIRHRLGQDTAFEVDTEEGESGALRAAESTASPTSPLIIVRLVHDDCTVSVDTSGAHLHMRGYRQAVAKAPLRETLAAALLLAGEWPGDVPLVDPLCGAGTIPIEAALLARRIPPGLSRRFAFMDWPGFDARLWAELVETARERILSVAPTPISGSDRDAGAVAAAVANAARAGVAQDVTFAERALSAAELPAGTGWVVTNPPYGARVGDPLALRNLYAALGNVLRKRAPGWRLVMLTADRALESQVGVRFRVAFQTTNGGIPVRAVCGEVLPQDLSAAVRRV